MRIKIIGENNCARATRHLLRLAGFAVTDYLPADAVIEGPAAGYAITIDLSPATHTPNAHLGPDRATQQQKSSTSEEADRIDRDASLPSFADASAGKPSFAERGAVVIAFPDGAAGRGSFSEGTSEVPSFEDGATGLPSFDKKNAGAPQIAGNAGGGLVSYIHFDSVDSALEAAVLRHIAQLAAGPVIVDRPGGVVRSERELRIVAPCSGDARADEAAAVAIEFGVLRGLLDLVAPDARSEMRWNGAGKKLLRGDGQGAANDGVGKTFDSRSRKKSWWPFAVILFGAALGLWRTSRAAVKAAAGPADALRDDAHRVSPGDRIANEFAEFCSARLPAGIVEDIPCSPEGERYTKQNSAISGEMQTGIFAGANLNSARAGELVGMVMEGHRLRPVLFGAGLSEAEPQGQFATGQGMKITDGVNFFVVDPCKAQTKLYASINQTGNTQLVAGTAAKKIYVCSIHVVAAAATNIAVVEGTGSVCATGTAGVSGFGGATAATGWNFAGNGGIALGNGDSSLGAEGTSGDNLCIFNSGSGQVSGGISYAVE